MKYEHELALEKVKQEHSTAAINSAGIDAKTPKVPLFDDNRDKMECPRTIDFVTLTYY